MGRFEDAYREISLAVELDPLSQGIMKDLGIHYYYTKQYDKAIETAMRTMELDPDFSPAYRLLSMSYEGKGMFEKAIEENQRWGKKSKNKNKTNIAMAYLLAVPGKKDEALNIINDPSIIKNIGANDHRSIALVYTALGENDKAFEWLEKSYQHREESLCSLKIDHKFDSLHSDPRFDGLLKKIGLID
jgi:tetratricopeptide (TPR) repeat protein